MVKKPHCDKTHNPGRWPYIAVCVKEVNHLKRHKGNHRDKFGQEWPQMGQQNAED